MTPELWNKVYYYIEDAAIDTAQDDIDSDFAVEVYEMDLDLRDLVREVWADIDRQVLSP